MYRIAFTKTFTERVDAEAARIELAQLYPDLPILRIWVDNTEERKAKPQINFGDKLIAEPYSAEFVKGRFFPELHIHRALHNGDKPIYVYGHVPDLSELADIKEEEQNIIDLLIEAVEYTNYRTVKVSFNHFEHLREKLEMELTDPATYCYTFYYKLMEGRLNAIKTEIGYTILLYTDNEQPHSVENQLFSDALKHGGYVREGLADFLNPNVGGIMDEDTLRIAGEIVYG